MGKATGFLEFDREPAPRRTVAERLKDWGEFYLQLPQAKAKEQGARCMDCGVPFCHTGCPLGNVIPDWNDLVYHGRWQEALKALHATNNFPEFTGRLCPAPCESACVLGIADPPVTIKQIEKTIVDRGWAEGWITPEPAPVSTGKAVAVVGSGPAGLAAAQQLARFGHAVTVFERADRIGGLLRYGIPSFKMEKHLIDRRIDQMRAEGVRFVTGAAIGADVATLRKDFDAVVLACGAEQPRDLNVPGRGLKGIHFAMDFLRRQNRRCEGDEIPDWDDISAKGKRVVIIGGGDTGADCLGTCLRQGAREVRQFELLPMPPLERSQATPWPLWPLQLRTESSHEEGGERHWSVATTAFTGDSQGAVSRLHAVRVGPAPTFIPEPGGEMEWEVELVLLAMGFTGPVHEGLAAELGLGFDARGNVAVDPRGMTSAHGVFAAGDMQRGQSLVVWAIASGRKVAADVHDFLGGQKL